MQSKKKLSVEENKYSYNRFNSRGVRVGQAVMDIISKEQQNYSVEDILDEFGRDWLDNIREIADVYKARYDDEFFIVSLLNKDLGQFGVANVLKHRHRVRQTKPTMDFVMECHPNDTKTLFRVSKISGEIELVWTLPGIQECYSILKTPKSYDEKLVKWVEEALKAIPLV